MKKNLSLPIAILILLSISAATYGTDKKDYIERRKGAVINWTQATILAKGSGGPPSDNQKSQARSAALRSAQMDARRKLLEIIPGIKIDNKTIVKNFTSKNNIIRLKIEHMVEKANIVKQAVLRDGTLEVTLEMSLTGGFAQLLLPPEIKQVEAVKPVVSVKKDEKAGPDRHKPATEVHTGLVIDARGLKIRPALAPKILDENRQEVYGSAYVSREYAVQHGMSAYTRDLKSAKIHPRVSDKPLIVKGLRTEGAGRTDIVISNSDSSRLRSASENLSFLKRCRIIIVAD